MESWYTQFSTVVLYNMSGGLVYSVYYCCIVQHVVEGWYTQSGTVVLYNMLWRVGVLKSSTVVLYNVLWWVGILTLVLLYCTTCLVCNAITVTVVMKPTNLF